MMFAWNLPGNIEFPFNEQVLAAVDRALCKEQLEKVRIIRSHMSSLELLILTPKQKASAKTCRCLLC